MWLFTKIGFFSVVKDIGTAEDVLMIRARLKQDLVKFKVQYKVPESIIESPKADYPYRMFVAKELVSVIVKEMVDGIDYANFKYEVAIQTPLEARSETNRSLQYHKVWEIMRKLK